MIKSLFCLLLLTVFCGPSGTSAAKIFSAPTGQTVVSSCSKAIDRRPVDPKDICRNINAMLPDIKYQTGQLTDKWRINPAEKSGLTLSDFAPDTNLKYFPH